MYWDRMESHPEKKNTTFFFSLFFLQNNSVQIVNITFLRPPCSVSPDDPDSDILVGVSRLLFSI